MGGGSGEVLRSGGVGEVLRSRGGGTEGQG